MGEAGNDTLIGGTGVDTFYGGPGDDTIRAADDSADIVDCGEGVDTVYVEADAPDARRPHRLRDGRPRSPPSRPTTRRRRGRRSAARATPTGSPAPPGEDSIFGRGGADKIFALEGDDYVDGDQGDDQLHGGARRRPDPRPPGPRPDLGRRGRRPHHRRPRQRPHLRRGGQRHDLRQHRRGQRSTAAPATTASTWSTARSPTAIACGPGQRHRVRRPARQGRQGLRERAQVAPDTVRA